MALLKTKYALVTGASGSIGRAIAVLLARKGYFVFVHCHRRKAEAKITLSEVERNCGRGFVVMGDIAKDRDVRKIFGQIGKVTKRLDLLVNNAGFDLALLIEDYSVKQMKSIIDTNLVGTIAVSKFALPLLKRGSQAAIINISSRMGKEKTIETVGPYAAAKAGVNKFTQCCALEFRKYKIRVNCVAPGLTETELSKRITPDKTFWRKQANLNPRGRVGRPEDVANCVAFLASTEADYINGETIGVNGGSVLV